MSEPMRFVQVRVPREEKRAWHEAARERDLRLAQFIRRAVRAEIAAVRGHKQDERDA